MPSPPDADTWTPRTHTIPSLLAPLQPSECLANLLLLLLCKPLPPNLQDLYSSGCKQVLSNLFRDLLSSFPLFHSDPLLVITEVPDGSSRARSPRLRFSSPGISRACQALLRWPLPAVAGPPQHQPPTFLETDDLDRPAAIAPYHHPVIRPPAWSSPPPGNFGRNWLRLSPATRASP